MDLPLVSILTPAYNSEGYISNLLESILNQTYPNVEMIIVDDGSTDGTKEVIVSYIPKFERRGYVLRYYYQENSGQSAAINFALKLFHGDLVAWPDSDDYYSSEYSIEKMVNALVQSDENTGCVFSYSKLTNGTEIIGERCYSNENNYIFYDCVNGENGFSFNPIGYMAKADKLVEVLQGREIYCSKNAGQNWQLLLPLFYNYKCKVLKEFLSVLYIHEDSHSHGQAGVLVNAYYQTLIRVLGKMKMSENEKSKVLDKIHKKYQIQIISQYLVEHKYDCLKVYYKQSSHKCFATRLMYLSTFMPSYILREILNIRRYIKQK